MTRYHFGKSYKIYPKQSLKFNIFLLFLVVCETQYAMNVKKTTTELVLPCNYYVRERNSFGLGPLGDENLSCIQL